MESRPGMPADPLLDPSSDASVLSVSALNRLARTTLERNLPLLRVAGEISNLTRAPSGHLYFTLKDDQAQVRCTMWRNRAQLLAFRPDNGMQVEMRAIATLYEVRGDFQLSVESLRQSGSGSLFEAYVRLRTRLETEGLFDPASRRAIPRFPSRVGVVTSPAAAAFQDVLASFRRRAPHIEVVLYPSAVQGAGAGAALAEAVLTASARASTDEIDLLLLVRGGGSLEDLWAFNDETLARSLRRCPVPVIAGIGHETDVTIADLAADVRAATPTGAAELASAGFHEAASRLVVLERALGSTMRARLHTLEQRLDRSTLRLRHPGERLARAAEHCTRLGARLGIALSRKLERSRADTKLLALRLRAASPELRHRAERLAGLDDRLRRSAAQWLSQHSRHIQGLSVRLEHLAPQSVLKRGYSITRDAHGRILRSSTEVAPGSDISVELAHGELAATITRTGG